MEIVRYDKSHLAKLTFLSDKMKMYYERLKNYILSFAKVKNGQAWDGERFYVGRNNLIRMQVRGKTLNLYFALDPNTLDSKYNVIDASEVKKYQNIPSLLKVKGPRSFNYAEELINEVMNVYDIPYDEEFAESYGLELKSRPLELLLKEGLVKPIYGNKVSSKSLDDDFDEEDDEEEEEEEIAIINEAKFIRTGYKKQQVARSLRCVINLDLLEDNYNDNEVVDLDTLKDKKLISNDILYVKLLATGNLTKKLTIKLNDISLNSLNKINKLKN